MVNFRVRDLDAMTAQLRAAGIAVEVDPQQYSNGRFARLHDPEAPTQSQCAHPARTEQSCRKRSQAWEWEWNYAGFRIVTGNNLLCRVLLCVFGSSLPSPLSHMNDNPTFFEAHFIHQRFH